METVATCFTTDSNGSYHELAPSFFEEMTRCWHQKHCRRRPDNPNGPSKFRKYRVYLPLLRLLCLHDRDCCSVADGSGSCHAPAPSYFEEMARCRHQKLHWRWPVNPNGRSKFHNLGLFTFTRSQLTLQRRLMVASRDRLNGTLPMSKHRRDDQNRSKFRKYENVCLRDQAKRLEKLLFAVTNDTTIDALRTVYFSAITCNGFCFHIR